jgi:hypothetical protein
LIILVGLVGIKIFIHSSLSIIKLCGLNQIREAHAAKFNYDLHAILADFQEQQKPSGRPVVSFARGYPCQENSDRLTEAVTEMPPTFQGQFTLSQDGQLTIENLPFQMGESVEVMVRSRQ